MAKKKTAKKKASKKVSKAPSGSTKDFENDLNNCMAVILKFNKDLQAVQQSIVSIQQEIGLIKQNQALPTKLLTEKGDE